LFHLPATLSAIIPVQALNEPCGRHVTADQFSVAKQNGRRPLTGIVKPSWYCSATGLAQRLGGADLPSFTSVPARKRQN
jgi:hypothetical protein